MPCSTNFLPLVSSMRGRKMLSQLRSVAGDDEPQDVTVDTQQRDHFTAFLKTLIDGDILRNAWVFGLNQNLVMDDIHNKLAALNPLERKTLESCIVEDNSIVADIIFHVWLETCRLSDDSFRQTTTSDKSLLKKSEYFGVSLFAVVMLDPIHPVVFRPNEGKTVANTTVGCSRLSRYHMLLSKMAKRFVKVVLETVCSKEIADKKLHSRAFCLPREKARKKLRDYLLSDKCPNHLVLSEQWNMFQEAEQQASNHSGAGGAAAAAAAGTSSEFL